MWMSRFATYNWQLSKAWQQKHGARNIEALSQNKHALCATEAHILSEQLRTWHSKRLLKQ
jgi:hypothetical protein